VKMNKRLLKYAEKAQKEGRLAWRVTNQHGCPCNGGHANPLSVGVWSEKVDDPQICKRGWHTTSDPLKWRGLRVWLVEGGECFGRDGDKLIWDRIRPLAEVDPEKCIDRRIWVRCNYSDLNRANLSHADLSHADLYGADLSHANLAHANLAHADLNRANLARANLYGADLNRADLSHANLYGANLACANLYDWERGEDGFARRR